MTGTVLAPVLYCDADGNLFPSEEPAYEASAGVTNDFLAAVGVRARYTAEELRTGYTGKNFRTTAPLLAAEEGVEVRPDVLDAWVRREADVVTAHLGRTLVPDPEVTTALRALASRHRLALVSSSASARLDVCLRATGLDDLFAPEVRFSAEDSLPEPRGKPDPAVYRFAAERLGTHPADGVAVEDSATGVRSAVGAGIPVLGHRRFVPAGERDARAAALREAGAFDVVDSWPAITRLLTAEHADAG